MAYVYQNFPNIFDFTFNPYALFSLTAFVLHFALLVFLFYKGYISSRVHQWFIFLILCMIVWGLGESLERLSVNVGTMIFWRNIGALGWVFLPLALFGFVSAFVGKSRILNNLFFQVIFWAPALFFLFLVWNTGLILSYSEEGQILTYFGWESLTGPLFIFYLIWLQVYIIYSFFWLFRGYFKSKSPEIKIQHFIIIVAFGTPFIISSITDAILPMFRILALETAPFLMSFSVFAVLYSILKYKLFAISPTETLDALLSTMKDAMLIFRSQESIAAANRNALALFGYSEEELVGMPIRKLFPSDEAWNVFSRDGLLPLSQGDEVRNLKTHFLTKDNKQVLVSFSASPIQGPQHQLQGIVAVVTDLTQQKALAEKFQKVSEELQFSKYKIERQLSKIVTPH